MRTEIRREGPRVPPPEFLEKLRDHNIDYGSPEVAVVWSPESINLGSGRWDPRWEVWIEVAENTHPDQKYVTAKGDRVQGGKTWRFLNTWRDHEDSFAPLDDRFFLALNRADTWSSKDHYQKNVVAPHERAEKAQFDLLKDAARGSAEYYHGYTNTSVSASTKGDWRSKMFWR